MYWRLLVGLIFVSSTESALAAPTFMSLGFFGGYESRATDVSADGRVVVGFSEPNIFRWTRFESTVRPGSQGRPSLSADGSVVVGRVSAPDGGEAFRWVIGQSFTPLGDLPGGVPYPISRAFDVSPDGRTVVGQGTTATGEEAFRWTPETGMRSLGDLSGGDTASRAHGVSADGTVIVGYGSGIDNHPQAVRWTNQSGMVTLGRPFGVLQSQANAVSADGLVVVGYNDYGPSSGTITRTEAFRWTEREGMTSLGDLPGARRYSIAHDISADGSVIVGSSDTRRDDGNDSRAAFYWTRERGMVNLRDLLISNGVTNLDGWRLTDARGVTPDGLTVVGTGIHDGRIEAWIATVPEPSTILLATFATLAMVGYSIRKLRVR